jgi:NADH-quinone oxidoreductase subunit M
MLFGPVTREENRSLADLRPREILISLPIVALIVWIGVAPETFLSKTSGSVDAVLRRVADARAVLPATAALEVEAR